MSLLYLRNSSYMIVALDIKSIMVYFEHETTNLREKLEKIK